MSDVVPFEMKQELQRRAGIPHLPTDLTYECRMAISGDGPRAYDWKDKPHRLVYDLSRCVESQATEIDRLRAELAKVEGERAADQADRMVKISALIANLTRVQEHYGDTCVYIRRGGMAWGAVALNREADDKKHGVFDLQAQHARDMQRMAELVERWKADCKAAEARALAAEAKVEEMGKALGGLVYEDEGRFFAGVIGDTDVTDIVAPALQPKEQT